MEEIKPGDKFRWVGPPVRSEHWNEQGKMDYVLDGRVLTVKKYTPHVGRDGKEFPQIEFEEDPEGDYWYWYEWEKFVRVEKDEKGQPTFGLD